LGAEEVWPQNEALGGARGATASEIAAVLHQHYDAGYDSALASLAADLTKAGNTGANELLMANGLWVQQGIAIQPAFQKTLADQYHAPLRRILYRSPS
jgi:serine protease inhibitor